VHDIADVRVLVCYGGSCGVCYAALHIAKILEVNNLDTSDKRVLIITSSNNDFQTVREVMDNDWEEFFARIPIEEQRQGTYVYEGQKAIDGHFPRGTSLQNVLGNHIFGHLIAEWE
jgi:hypothetical protein